MCVCVCVCVCVRACACGGGEQWDDWVLKLGLQRTHLGRVLGLAARRQPEGAGE